MFVTLPYKVHKSKNACNNINLSCFMLDVNIEFLFLSNNYLTFCALVCLLFHWRRLHFYCWWFFYSFMPFLLLFYCSVLPLFRLCCLFNKIRTLYNYVSNFGFTDHPNKIQTIRYNYSVKIFTKFAYHLICREIILPYRPVRCLRHQPNEISEQDVNKKRLLWSQIRQFCFLKSS